MDAKKLVLSAREAAELLGISERHLYNLRKTQGLPWLRLGQRVVYPLDALQAWIAERTERDASNTEAGR
ncbi:MAG: DNA-binding protein [Planctomycetota bacterium]|nr:MAG: DNA-binding protein [Planctomycetota bacterium]